MKHLLLLLIFSAIFVSCNKDLIIDLPNEPSKLVIESYLSVGDSLLIRIGESGLPSNANGFHSIISDADARIIVDGVSYPLSFSSRGFGTREGSFYYLTKIVHTVKSGTRYDLIVEHNGRKVSSFTETFPALDIVRAEAFLSTFSEKDTMIGLRIQTDFPPGESYFECKWMIPVPMKVNLGGKDTIITIVGSVFEKQFLHREGESTIVEFNIGQKKTQELSTGYIGFVKLTRISKLQHDFLQAIDVQKDDYSLFTETTEIPTNIEGGYGIFTSTVSDTLTVKVVR